jgi:hypothetical protein
MIIYISTIGRYVRAFEFGQCIPSTSTGILLPQLSSGFGETLPVAFASWDTSPTLPAGCKFQLSLSRLCGVLCSDARRAAYALEKLRTLLLCYSQYASDFRHLQTYLRDTLRGCWACSRLLRIDLLNLIESVQFYSILFKCQSLSDSARLQPFDFEEKTGKLTCEILWLCDSGHTGWSQGQVAGGLNSPRFVCKFRVVPLLSALVSARMVAKRHGIAWELLSGCCAIISMYLVSSWVSEKLYRLA